MSVIIVDLMPLIIRETFGHQLWTERELAITIAHKIVSFGDTVVVAIDSKKSLRKNEDSAYKKKRKLPPEISRKIGKVTQMVIRLLREANIPMYQAEGYEADDVIATLCKTKYKDTDKVIVSSDKDLYQILDERTVIFTGSKFITDETFRKEYGIEPKDWVTVQSLAGDRTDEVVGVKGIGIKTALKLVKHHGERVEEALTEEQREQFKRARKMVKLRLIENIQEVSHDLSSQGN